MTTKAEQIDSLIEQLECTQVDLEFLRSRIRKLINKYKTIPAEDLWEHIWDAKRMIISDLERILPDNIPNIWPTI